jgi:fatty acid desaturase
MSAKRPTLEREFHREMRQLYWYRWLAAAVGDWLVIVGTFVLVAWIDHPLFYALAVFPLGSRQQALGALFHDASHHLVCRNRMRNDVLGNLLSAFPLGLTLDGYRRYHLIHHRQLGTQNDPENHHKRTLPQWDLPIQLPRVVGHFVSDLLGAGVPHLLAAAQLTRPLWQHAAALFGFWLVVAAIFVKLKMLWIPVLWVISIATVFWSGVRFRIFTEHLGLSDTHRLRIPTWLVWFWMPHNIGLHWEHHHFPGVPFYHLPKVRQALPQPHLTELWQLWTDFRELPGLRSGDVYGHTSQDVNELSNAKTRPESTEERTKFFAISSVYLHVILPLLLGTLTYVVARQRAPQAMVWLADVGLQLHRAEFHQERWVTMVANWFPDAAWSYALTAALCLVWAGQKSQARFFWIAAGPALALCWEGSQLLGMLPGVFSVSDVVASLAASALAIVIFKQALLHGEKM